MLKLASQRVGIPPYLQLGLSFFGAAPDVSQNQLVLSVRLKVDQLHPLPEDVESGEGVFVGLQPKRRDKAGKINARLSRWGKI